MNTTVSNVDNTDNIPEEHLVRLQKLADSMEIYKVPPMLSPLPETPPARRTATVGEEAGDILQLYASPLPTTPEPPPSPQVPEWKAKWTSWCKPPRISTPSPRTRRCRIRFSPLPTTPEAPRTPRALPPESPRTPRFQSHSPTGTYSPVTPEVPITPELRNFPAPALPEAAVVPAAPNPPGYPVGVQPLPGKKQQDV
ncbi:hypothetical protein CBL_20291 [Carabus blaptoides fortunei]